MNFKDGTRVSEKIAEENTETLAFIRNMIVAANVVHYTGMMLFSSGYYTTDIVMFLVCAGIYLGSYLFMAKLGKPKYGSDKTLLDSGLDLGRAGGDMVERAM